MNGQQIRHGIAGGGQSQIWSIDNFGNQRCAARNFDGLAAVRRFVATGAPALSCICAAEIFGPWKLVAAVIDHVVAADPRHDLRTQLFNLDLNGNGGHDQERLQYVRGNHDPQGNQTKWSFSGQAGFRPREGGLDGGDKIVPPRRPLDLQLGKIVPGLTKQDNFPDLESVAHAGSLLRVGTVISIVSPICVFVSDNVRLGSSSTDAASRRTGATRHGRSSAWA